MQAPRSLVDVALGTDREATFAYAGPDQTQRTQKNTILFTDNVFGLASETAGPDAQYYTRDNQGRLVSVRTPQGSHYYLTDNIGSVVALTGPGPNVDVSASYRYDPFGQSTDTTGDLIQPYRYAGEYLDTETGHYKIGARYYNPQLGRWTQQDPLTGYTDPKRINRYPYAEGDPVNLTDPTGLIVPCYGGPYNNIRAKATGCRRRTFTGDGTDCLLGVTGIGIAGISFLVPGLTVYSASLAAAGGGVSLISAARSC